MVHRSWIKYLSSHGNQGYQGTLSPIENAGWGFLEEVGLEVAGKGWCLSPLYTRPTSFLHTKTASWGAIFMLPWRTSAHGFRHLLCPQPRTSSSLPPPVLPSSWGWVLLFTQQSTTVSVHTLSLELSRGVLHSPAPLIGWPGGAVAAGECGGQHRRNYSRFVAWWEWSYVV